MLEQKHLDILKHCAEANSTEFNAMKALEESSEFNEALLKFFTKHPNNPKKPDVTEITKEYGDFLYRGMIILMQLSGKSFQELEHFLHFHIAYKLDNLIEYKEDGKYREGL